MPTPARRLRWLAPRLVGSAAVLLGPLVAMLPLGWGWLKPATPATPDHQASDLGELPLELWPLVVLVLVVCWVVGLRAVWR